MRHGFAPGWGGGYFCLCGFGRVVLGAVGALEVEADGGGRVRLVFGGEEFVFELGGFTVEGIPHDSVRLNKQRL